MLCTFAFSPGQGIFWLNHSANSFDGDCWRAGTWSICGALPCCALFSHQKEYNVAWQKKQSNSDNGNRIVLSECNAGKKLLSNLEMILPERNKYTKNRQQEYRQCERKQRIVQFHRKVENQLESNTYAARRTITVLFLLLFRLYFWLFSLYLVS